MPNTQALQVFYGTLPLLIAILLMWLREQTILKDILARLTSMETSLRSYGERLTRLEERVPPLVHHN